MRVLRERVTGAAEVMLASARMQIAEMRSVHVNVVFMVIQPAALLLVALLPRDDPGPAEATRVAVGVLLTSFWTATVWGAAGVLRRDRAMGTLMRALTGVRDARLVVIGRGLGSSCVVVVVATLTVAAVLGALRQPVAVARPDLLVLGLIVVLSSGAAIGLLVGSVFVLTRHGPQVSSALMYPVFLLGGMLLPPQMFPAPLEWASYGISTRWLAEFIAGATAGSVEIRSLGAAVALTVAYGVMGAILFSRVVHRARREATFDLT